MTALDPITLEVLRGGLIFAAREMKHVTVRTAYSPLWKAAGDVSCGILTPAADLVAQGPSDIPVHLGSMPTSMAGILEAIAISELEDGDIILHNDPYLGNNHLPDTIMAKPVFVDGSLVAFTAVRGHYIDIGGLRPGSYTTLARDVYGEGLRIPPVKIYRRGEPVADLFRMIGANTRNPTALIGDIRAQYAGCLAGERRLRDLVDRYGLDTVENGFDAILDHGERLTIAAIHDLGQGSFRFEDFCDDDGQSVDPIRLTVEVTIEGDRMRVDFAGTDPQVETYMNAPVAVTSSATYYAVLSFLGGSVPANSGAYRAIEITAPEGSVVNPRHPAAVAAGNHETANRISDVVLGALGQADRLRAVGASAGSSCGYHFTELRRAGSEGSRERRVWIEIHGASRGGGFKYDGPHAVQGGIGNTSNTPIEEIESAYPVRVEELAIQQDSGGPGRWRGGSAVRRRFRVLCDDAQLTVLSERAVVPPYGIGGGKPGHLAYAHIWGTEPPPALVLGEAPDIEVDGTTVPGCWIRAKADALLISRDTRFEIGAAGGGGYGNPAERSPTAVVEDLEDGYVSLASARDNYRVAVTEREHEGARPRFELDEDATRLLRAAGELREGTGS